jgi:predicted metal-binding protein
VTIDPGRVVTGSWVNKKCKYGCYRFGKNLQCPPHAMAYMETRSMLDEYTSAILVQGQPPGQRFHEKLLRLEKGAFLAGEHKAFVFGAGPCPICPKCPEVGQCRYHNLARPSMEGAGIDVYATAERVGWSLTPVREKGDYINYIGLLLVS